MTRPMPRCVTLAAALAIGLGAGCPRTPPPDPAPRGRTTAPAPHPDRPAARPGADRPPKRVGGPPPCQGPEALACRQRRVDAALERHRAAILARPGVRFVGPGWHSRRPQTPAIIIGVDERVRQLAQLKLPALHVPVELEDLSAGRTLEDGEDDGSVPPPRPVDLGEGASSSPSSPSSRSRRSSIGGLLSGSQPVWRPSRAIVRRAFRRIIGPSRACGQRFRVRGVVRVRVLIRGPTGRASVATVRGSHAGTPVARCIESAVRTHLRVPKFPRPSFSVVYPIVLR